MPARDIGPPYLARFSAESGMGALATTVWVMVAPVAVSIVVVDVRGAGSVAGVTGGGPGSGAGVCARAALLSRVAARVAESRRGIDMF